MEIAAKGKTKRVPATPGPDLATRVRALGLYGLLASWKEIEDEDWVLRLVEIEENERGRRSLERRMRNARLGRFRPMADFDWKWPRKIDRAQIEEALRLDFFGDDANVILVGKNGVGKTMIAKNIAHQAVLSGRTVLTATASELLCDLGAQESTPAMMRRLRRYVNPALLVLDEVGYLSASAKHADLLFDVVSQRYRANRPVVLTTNKPFREWGEVFAGSGCVVTLVDRLVHRSEIIVIDGDSYRNKEAQERQRAKASKRGGVVEGKAAAHEPG